MQNKNILTNKLLYYITFFFGFSSAITQVVLIREMLTIFRGNELIIGIIFSAWFSGIFIGARYNPESDIRKLERRVVFCLILFPVVSLFMIYLHHSISFFFPVTAGTFYSITHELILSIFFAVIASFFIGFSFPSIVSLISKIDSETSGGKVYCVESFGAFAGGIVFSYIFINYFNPLGIVSFLIFISLILVAVIYRNYKCLILLLVPAVIFISSEQVEKNFFKYLWDNSHSGKMLEYKRTKYQTIAIETREDVISIYGDGVFYYNIPDRFESRGVFHLIQSLRKKSNDELLLFGASPGSILFNTLKTNIKSLSYFEIDQDLWNISDKYSRRFYNSTNDYKLKIIKDDLRHYFSKSKKKFDMIICLAPPPENAMLNRFYTKEFFSMCRDHLQPGGIFFTSIYGFSNYLSPVLKKYIASIYKSFREIFPYSLNTSGETIYLMGAAESGVIPENCRDLISGYKDKFASLQKYNLEKEIIENFDAQEFRMLFEESQLEYFKKKIENSIPDADANLDLKPKAYWNKILLSAYQEESVIYDLLNKYYLLPLVVLFITFFVFYDIRKAYGDERVASAFTIFVIGFTSISTLILLIILFQNYYGILFYRISLINALFMLGLASGSYFANRFEIKILSSFLLSLSGMLFVLIIYTVYNNEYLFWGIILFYSFLCGTVFPLLFKNISGKDYHKTASLLNALENYGSVTGSLLTAVFLVPVIGIIGTIYVNMGLLFAGAIAVRRRADCL